MDGHTPRIAVILLLVATGVGATHTGPQEPHVECMGLTEVRLVRDVGWSCESVTDYPELQVPRLVCDAGNRFVPGVFTVRNESTGFGMDETTEAHRLALVPTYSYDDEGRLKYEFQLKRMQCKNGRVHGVVVVHNRRVRTPHDRFVESIVMLLIILLLVALCACAVAIDDTDGSDFFAGVLLGSAFSDDRESKAHFE